MAKKERDLQINNIRRKEGKSYQRRRTEDSTKIIDIVLNSGEMCMHAYAFTSM
jgi:hypothetical protein